MKEYEHHSNGHFFRDANQDELPPYHGPRGEHILYMEPTDISLLLEAFPKMRSAKVRVKLLKDDEPTEWSAWLTCPVQGYLELDQYGPVPTKDIEWLEVRISY